MSVCFGDHGYNIFMQGRTKLSRGGPAIDGSRFAHREILTMNIIKAAGVAMFSIPAKYSQKIWRG